MFVQVQMGNMERALGHYAEALRWLEEGRAILGEYVPKVVGAAHTGLAHLWLDLGQAGAGPTAARPGAGDPLRPGRCSTPSPTCWWRGRRWRRASATLPPRRWPSPATFIIDSTRYAVRAQAALLAAQLQEPEAAYASALEVAREAGRLHMMGLRIDALVFAARAAQACGRPAVASTHALEALGLWPEHAPDALYIGDVWLAALESSSDAAAAAAILDAARRWIEAAAAAPSRGVPRLLSRSQSGQPDPAGPGRVAPGRRPEIEGVRA